LDLVNVQRKLRFRLFITILNFFFTIIFNIAVRWLLRCLLKILLLPDGDSGPLLHALIASGSDQHQSVEGHDPRCISPNLRKI